MLKAGTELADALGLLACLEANTPAGATWRSGDGAWLKATLGSPEIAAGSRVVPPLFSWLVSSGEEDMAGASKSAAEIYQARANYRVEMLLYAALPVSILFWGSCWSARPPGDSACSCSSALCSIAWDNEACEISWVWSASIVAGLIPLYALCYLVYFIIGLPFRRQERARLFLDLISTGLRQGRSIEQRSCPISHSQDRLVGCGFISWRPTWKAAGA